MNRLTFINIIVYTCVLCWPFLLIAQENEKPKQWEITGYVKYLHDISYTSADKNYNSNQQIHNRLNFNYYLSNSFTIQSALRTRFFYGGKVKNDLNFPERIEQGNNNYFDLSTHLINDNQILLNSNIDRLFIEYVKDDFELRLGRQRIAWGVETLWNPNDIFNTFSFLDFDYEERPGTDAILLRKYFGYTSSLEFVTNVFDRWDEAIIAMLFKWNKNQYDFQLLGGIRNGNYTTGIGFAGNLNQAAIKGELSYFIPWKSNQKSIINTTISYEQVFKNGLLFRIAYLYNSFGTTNGVTALIHSFPFSAANVYPFQHSILLGLGIPDNPLVTGKLTIIYNPIQSNNFLINPEIGWGLSNSWDIFLLGQFGLDSADKKYSNDFSSIFLRLKYSF